MNDLFTYDHLKEIFKVTDKDMQTYIRDGWIVKWAIGDLDRYQIIESILKMLEIENRMSHVLMSIKGMTNVAERIYAL